MFASAKFMNLKFTYQTCTDLSTKQTNQLNLLEIDTKHRFASLTLPCHTVRNIQIYQLIVTYTHTPMGAAIT